MSPRALIADDEANLARDLRDRLHALWPTLEILDLASNGLAALRAVEASAPDVVFLDIRMPGLTGIEIARRIDPRTHVVFVTAYDQYAVEAFEREAVDYLLKPVSDERLARALPGAGVAPKLRWVRALKGEVVQQIPVDEVLYFQASDKYTCVMTGAGEYLIRTPLSELAAQLDGEVFWQIHRGTVVNMNEVAATRRDLTGRVFVRLRHGNAELAVSRAYAHRFRQM